MSDLEEMDNDRLNALESILYASIHYNDATSGEQDQLTLGADLDAQTMPPPPQQIQQQQQQQHTRIVSDKRVINNATARPRYWAETTKAISEPASVVETGKPKTSEVTPVEATTTTEAPTSVAPKGMLPPAPAKNTSEIAKPNTPKKQTKQLNSVQQLLHQQQQQKKKQLQQQLPKKPQQQQGQLQIQKPPKPQQQTTSKATNDDEPERFDQRLLVAIPPNWSKLKREKANQAVAPFAKANRKLEKLQRLEEKRQKSKRVQNNKKLKQTKQQPIEHINLIDSESSSNEDDVIIVPLPPVPIINVDCSDDDEVKEEEAEEPEPERESAQPYLEENAMDAADVRMGAINYAVEPVTVSSVLSSPCNSVLSSDDFIVQKDTSRLLADRARATDEDLLVLTENAIIDDAEPDIQTEMDTDRELVPDNSSEYEFVPPSKLEEIKQNFRVDEQQFRALDVYESESDLNESGIYCKAKQKATPTIIRSVDSDSDTTDVEAVVEDNVVKTKRLRKRRASSTKDTQSDPNNEPMDMEDDETDSDNDRAATGVPGIARGMAVERCKRKIRRLSQRRGSDTAIATAPRKVEPYGGSSESGAEESLPTARQIAERLLRQEQPKEDAVDHSLNASGDAVSIATEGSDANTEDEAEMNNAVTEQMSEVFESIDLQTQRAAQNKQLYMDNSQQEEVSTTEPQPEADNLEPVTEDDNALQVEHNMSELKAELSGGDLVGWNDEMCRFYNDSWNGEQFNMVKLFKAMNGQRNEWRINNSDRFPVMRKRSNMKCTNCFEMGHMRAKCPRPRKPVICYTCGITGHAEPRCPKAICMGCGAKQALYVQKCNKCSFHSRMVCQLCKMRGHGTDMCPDKWRRYHSTTRSNVPLEGNVQYRAKHCSYCSARGHLFEECRQRIGEYRNTNYSSLIMSHQKVYKDRSGPLSYLSGETFFFACDTPFHFNWSSEFSKGSCYARFLKAVGMARPQPKQKKAIATQKVKIYTNDYVPNPAARAALGKAPATSTVIIEELPAQNAAESEAEAAAAPTQPEITIITPSKPIEAKTSPKPSSIVSPAMGKSSVTPHDLDSDSNYSFSEHFEVSSSTTTLNETEPNKSGPMENLPEMIPLSLDNEDDNESLSVSSNTRGISMCVTSKATSTSTSTVAAQPEEELPDVPSEAKIVLPQDQSQYLFTPEGNQFLTALAAQCNVSVRMELKEYGYVLVIYGLKKGQEDMHSKLLHRNQEEKRKSADFQSQKPPKRIDVLIRFMRDGINSLTGDLGNAKNHYMRIKELEQMNTKNGFKLAERKRRLLNMILFGQAGLGNGSLHLDQLLVMLKRLLEHSPEENATPAMRNEIEEHWRVIFTPLANENYESLLQSYARLEVKNRMKTLKIEPAVLGVSPRKASPTHRRIASPPPPPPVWQIDATSNANKNRLPKQRALLNGKWLDSQTPLPPVWQQEEQQQQQQQQQHHQQPQQQSNSNNIRATKSRAQQQHEDRLLAMQQQQQQLQSSQHNNSGNNRAAKPRAQQQQQRQVPLPPIWQQEGQQQQLQHINSASNKLRPPKQQRAQPYARQSGQQQTAQLQHQQSPQLPFNNMQQRSHVGLHMQRNQSECVKLLAGMERDSRGSINTDASKPSMFWSRESLKYLDQLFQTTVNPETLERLHRVLDRSRRGLLSHNDYRAVIKLHSMGPN